MGKNVKTGYVNKKINGIKINTNLECNPSNFNECSMREIDFVVAHYTGNEEDNAKSNANFFVSADRQASAHFFVDDKNIYQSVKLKDVAWHCGSETGVYYHNKCRNVNSLGVEMCCTAGNYKISNKTLINSAYLIAELCKEAGIGAKDVDKCVLRHYDITHKKCPAQFVGAGKRYNEWKKFKKMIKNILNGKNYDGSFKENVVVVISNTNIRKGAGITHKIVGKVQKNDVYTIIEEKNGWGKLKSGAGWIYLKRTEKK